MATLIHRAESRGISEYGWLYSRHTFSFADYFNKNRIQFGMLRVLNDDIFGPGGGFPMHSHKNMEIVTIMLKGTLRHEDSIGNTYVLHEGEVQAMSAGTGVLHSEFNHSDTEQLNLLQIWVMPRVYNIQPRYEQKDFGTDHADDCFHLVVGPDKNNGTLWINQTAYFYMGKFSKQSEVRYSLHDQNNGVYLFVIDGAISSQMEMLNQRDGMGISGINSLSFTAIENSHLLLMEVPMD